MTRGGLAGEAGGQGPSASGALARRDAERLIRRALPSSKRIGCAPSPQRFATEGIEILQAGRQRDEMVAGELAHLGGEADATVGEQDLGLADAAGIEDDLAGRGKLVAFS